MSSDMTILSNTFFLSQMGRDVTRLTNTVSVTNDQDMTNLTKTLSVTNDQGYDEANRYFISHK
jgi:stress response protein SCP2